jgi:hypothetical protein
MSYIVDMNVKGSRGGDLTVRTTSFNEIGIIEGKPAETGIYWNIEDFDKVINALKEAKQRHIGKVV